jgi:hypothetical protein
MVVENFKVGRMGERKNSSDVVLKFDCSNKADAACRVILWSPRRRCGCGEIGIRGGLKIHWGFPRCRFESDQPHHFTFTLNPFLDERPARRSRRCAEDLRGLGCAPLPACCRRVRVGPTSPNGRIAFAQRTSGWSHGPLTALAIVFRSRRASRIAAKQSGDGRLGAGLRQSKPHAKIDEGIPVFMHPKVWLWLGARAASKGSPGWARWRSAGFSSIQRIRLRTARCSRCFSISLLDRKCARGR